MDSRSRGEVSFAFGPYEADLSSSELRKNGVRIKIQDLPLRLLAVLAEKSGRVVTRQELQKRLWPSDTFVDFEDGLNTAVRKLREALSDDPDNPRYIETVPRHGYRFIAEVEFPNGNSSKQAAVVTTFLPSGESPFSDTASPPPSATVSATPTATVASQESSLGKAILKRGPLVGLFATLTLAGVAVWLFYGRAALSFNSHDSVLVADFDNETGDPRFDEALQSAFTVSLEQSRHTNVFPRARLASILGMMGKSPSERITPSLGREICEREAVRGLIAAGITRTGNEYELTAELIDPQTGEAVRSYSERSYGEEHVLDALDVIAADIRRDLGESLYQIHRADRKLPEVTTSSLTALKQYADGSLLWHQGRFQDAVTLLRAAVQSDPNFAMAHAALGNAYFSYLTNDPLDGKREYEKAFALSSRTTEREHMIIQTEYADDLGHVDEAGALYRTYLERYPGDWKMLSDYAHLLRRHGRQLEAVAQYNQILKVAPDDAKTYIEMATAYLTLDQLPQALQAYSEAFRLDPHWLTAGNTSREYGSVLVQSGEEPKAQQVFTDMLEKPETRESGMRSLAMLDLYHGRYAEGQKRFRECLLILQNQQAPLSVARVHLWLAFVAEGQGDTRAETQELDTAMQDFKAIGPKVIIGTWIGQAYARSGSLDKARKIEVIVAPLTDDKSAEQSGYLHLLQGEIALAQKNNDKAIELFTLSNKENPTALSAEALAHAYQQAGRTNEAITAYEQFLSQQNRALLWEPQQRWLAAHYALGVDYLARGDRDKAKKTIRQLLDLWKGADPNLPLRKQAHSEYAKLQ
jgi:eukaryotic-like serine/threonine-protein kinase